MAVCPDHSWLRPPGGVRSSRRPPRTTLPRRLLPLIAALVASTGCGSGTSDSAASGPGSGTADSAASGPGSGTSDSAASVTGPGASDSIASGPGLEASTLAAGSTDPDAASLRVVSLIPSLTEIVVALGATPQLVARTDYDTDPALGALPSIGGGLDPSLETLVGLDVDLVLMPGVRDTPALVDRLASLGIESMVLETETVADLYHASEAIGARLDRVARADSMNASIEEALARVESRIEGRARVPVMYVVWGEPPMTAGPRTYVDELIRIAGGRNVFDDAPLQWPTVSFEAIVDRAPEVIIWPRGEVNATNLDDLAARPGWRDVSAIQAGRVLLVDADLFNRPGPGVVEAARLLARRLHPGAF